MKAHIIKTLQELDSYPWSGHSVLMGRKNLPWQDAAYVLSWFNEKKQSYRSFVQKGIETPEADLDGGGLIRSSGGKVSSAQRKNPVYADQRILGTGDFVKNLLEKKIKQKIIDDEERRQTIEGTLQSCCKNAGITLHELQGGSRARHISHTRLEIARSLSKELGISYAEIARHLRVSAVAVLKMMKRESRT